MGRSCTLEVESGCEGHVYILYIIATAWGTYARIGICWVSSSDTLLIRTT